MNWKRVKGTEEVKPLAVDTESSATTVYIRKNIVRFTETTESGVIQGWERDELEIAKNDIQSFAGLVAEIIPIIEKQDTIMLALADIYERLEA